MFGIFVQMGNKKLKNFSDSCEKNACRELPCKNGGTCSMLNTDIHTCLCREGYTGRSRTILIKSRPVMKTRTKNLNVTIKDIFCSCTLSYRKKQQHVN